MLRAHTLILAVLLATPSLAPAQAAPARPDFSGVWGQTAMPQGAELWTTVTVKQTANAIEIQRVGTYNAQPITLAAVVPLDTARARGTITVAGATSDISVSSAWETQTLVVTSEGNTNGTQWQLVERWTLGADRASISLVPAYTVSGTSIPVPTVVLTKR